MATITTTPIRVFASGETVTPTKLNELAQSTVELTAGTIVNADISASAAVALSKLATGALPTGITVASANLVDGTIVNADINASAAIVGSKLADTTITTAKLAAATQQSLVPAGAVMPFAMNSAPSGWLAADGTAVSRTTYATLFAAIGTAHGSGDGSTTFNLPDLRGIFVRGSGSQTIGGITYNKTFAAKEGDAFQGHHHNYHYSSGNRGVSSAVNTVDLVDQVNPTDILTDRVKASISDGTNGTPRTASETRPANIALLYCIKF